MTVNAKDLLCILLQQSFSGDIWECRWLLGKKIYFFNKYYFIIMTITIKTRRLRVNKLLARRELLLDVYHEGKPNVSQKDLRELIAAKYKW